MNERPVVVGDELVPVEGHQPPYPFIVTAIGSDRWFFGTSWISFDAATSESSRWTHKDGSSLQVPSGENVSTSRFPASRFPGYPSIELGDRIQHRGSKQWGKVLEIIPQHDGSSEIKILREQRSPADLSGEGWWATYHIGRVQKPGDPDGGSIY
jgi:hypothetical protein